MANPTDEIYRVRLGGPTTTDQIVQAWRGAGLYVDNYITQDNFPLKPHAIKEVEIEILDPGRSFSEDEGLKFLETAGLERPTEEHALRFAEQCGITTTGKKPFIIFLVPVEYHHRSRQGPRGDRRVVSLDRPTGYHGLSLPYADRGFNDLCVLAGVRPYK